MLVRLHSQATTTPKVRADIQASDEPAWVLTEHGSFSKVGRLRGQAPSSIARRLDRLKNYLNKRLFNCAPTGLFLTAEGTRKLIEGRALTTAAASFATRDGEDGILRGHLVISAPSRLGETLIAQAVAQFLKTHPDVSIDLHFTDLLQDIERDKIDLSIRIGTQAPDHHFIRRIVENQRVLVAAPAYLAGFDPSPTWRPIAGCFWAGRTAGSSCIQINPSMSQAPRRA